MEFVNAKRQTYYLHSKIVILKGSKKEHRIYWFARTKSKFAISEIPAGYEVMEFKKTGLPVLKKSK